MSDQEAKRLKMDVGGESGAQRKSTSPKKICDFSTQKFAPIIGCEAFVDKTLFIKAFFEERGMLALAPRLFGKSTNMDMVKEFVSGNKKLFIDNRLKIYEEERDFFNKHCKENPVIHVDFKNVGGKTEDEVLTSMKIAIQDAYNDHKYLVTMVGENWAWIDKKYMYYFMTVKQFVKYWKKPENLTKYEVIRGLALLSECLHVYHGKPVYVFIDEYDAPIMNAIMKTNPGDEVVAETIKLIGKVMYRLLKDNKHVKSWLINACVQIADVFSEEIGNIHYYDYRFPKIPWPAPYFGFTDEEVKTLFAKDEFVTLKNDDEVQKWYNSYKLMRKGKEYVIYNGYSILKYLAKSREMNKPQFDTYWVDLESFTNLKELFAKTEIRRHIEDLINDEAISMQSIRHMSENTKNGYLNTTPPNSTGSLKVPNEEIKQLLKQNCYDVEFFEEKHQLRPAKVRQYAEALYSLLQQKDRIAFIRFAKAVSELFGGALMPNNEYELYSILFTLVYNFKQYEVGSDLSVKRIKRTGRLPHLDILVILGDVGMIIEPKFNAESSEMAHTLILTEGYDTAFNEYGNVTTKVLLGLHMNGDTEVSLTYMVDNSAKQTVTSND